MLEPPAALTSRPSLTPQRTLSLPEVAMSLLEGSRSTSSPEAVIRQHPPATRKENRKGKRRVNRKLELARARRTCADNSWKVGIWTQEDGGAGWERMKPRIATPGGGRRSGESAVHCTGAGTGTSIEEKRRVNTSPRHSRSSERWRRGAAARRSRAAARTSAH